MPAWVDSPTRDEHLEAARSRPIISPFARITRFLGTLRTKKSKTSRRKPRRVTLRLEALETRDCPTGITEFALGAGHAPFQIVAGPNNSLYVSETIANRIGVVSSSGAFTDVPVPTAGSSPLGIAAGSDGGVWFAQQLKNELGRLDPNTLTITGQISNTGA